MINGREILLAAGAIHSPAVLQRSGIGPAAHLRSLGITVLVDLPVGEGFQEHPSVYFGFPVIDELRPPANNRHTNACVRWSSGAADALSNDMMSIVIGPSPLAPALAGLGLWVNQPLSRGRVRITSTDPEEDPDVDMNLIGDDRDRMRLRDAVSVAGDVLAHPAFAALMTGAPCGLDGTPLAALLCGEADLDAWIERVVDGSAHASATCPLGPVLDNDCRVLGTDNLRVVDLSIVPSVPRANTNLTAIMIGEHVAARLRR